MHRHMPMVGAVSLAALMSAACSASAQLALSANDGKAVLVDGVNSVPANPPADSVTVIDLSATPPKVVAEIPGPDQRCRSAFERRDRARREFRARDGGIEDRSGRSEEGHPRRQAHGDRPQGLAAQGHGAAAGGQRGGRRVDQSRRHARAGRQPVGRDGVGLFHRRQGAHAGRQGHSRRRQVGPEPCRHHPGRQDGAGHARRRQQDFGAVDRRQPRSSTPSATSRRGCGRTVSISIRTARSPSWRTSGPAAAMQIPSVSIDIEAKPARVVHTVTVGQTPEGIALSPDGAFVAVSVMNGSNKPKSSPFFNDYGVVKVLERQGQRTGSADRGQGRPLVSGSRLEQGESHATGAVHGREGDHGVSASTARSSSRRDRSSSMPARPRSGRPSREWQVGPVEPRLHRIAPRCAARPRWI